MFTIICSKQDYILIPTEEEYVLIKKVVINEIVLVAKADSNFFDVIVIDTNGITKTYKVSTSYREHIIRNCKNFINGIGSILYG